MIQSPEINTDRADLAANLATNRAADVSEAAKATGRNAGNGRRVQRTVNFDREILDRARAAATYLARTQPTAGVRSLADIVNPAVAERVAELEARFNDGRPFQPVFRMPPGRRASRADIDPDEVTEPG